VCVCVCVCQLLTASIVQLAVDTFALKHTALTVSQCVCVRVCPANCVVRVCLKSMTLNFDITDPPDSLKHSAKSERGGVQTNY